MEPMHLMERLRPIMVLKSWDYCVLWKLSEDQRFLEWICCCCGGAEKNIHKCEQEIMFPNSTCRDVMFQHPRTTACDLLAQVPSSLLLDCGCYAQALLSNQAKWLNFVPFSESNMSDEIMGTRALVPSPLGLLELFSIQQLPEDEKVIEFVATQCNIYLEQQVMMNSGFSNQGQENVLEPFSLEEDDPIKDCQNHYQQTVTPAVTSKDHSDHLSYDFSLKRKELDTCSTNFLPQLSTYSISEVDNNAGGNMLFDQNTSDVTHFSNSAENRYMSEMDAYLQKQMISSSTQVGIDDESVKHDNARSNSGSDSDQNEEEDDSKYRRRNGKGPQSKNLIAERKRRKKLNERLYALRALVPNISKLDRASILGDAIEYVMELQKQVRDLQLELEEHSNDEGGRNQDQIHSDVLSHNGNKNRTKSENGKLSNGSNRELSINSNGNNDSFRKYQEVEENDKLQEMEPQVEVAQLDGNEFFVKVFREHKAGGFVGILEALNSLGLEVTNVNATRHTCLVSSIFEVERLVLKWMEHYQIITQMEVQIFSTIIIQHHRHDHHLDNNLHKQANLHHFHRHHHH
ncbi:unnamed protein product [Withania somnifera]